MTFSKGYLLRFAIAGTSFFAAAYYALDIYKFLPPSNVAATDDFSPLFSKPVIGIILGMAFLSGGFLAGSILAATNLKRKFPWIKAIALGFLVTIISAFGGGFSFYLSGSEMRLDETAYLISLKEAFLIIFCSIYFGVFGALFVTPISLPIGGATGLALYSASWCYWRLRGNSNE
ncbi:hypothetical protein JNK13_11990 [bacterium]|nr:hypothetical protein [bacterium]